MGADVTTRRRIIGAIFLLIALGMLIAGDTLLKAILKDIGYLVYWLVCFVFTGLAILVAYLDVRALQQRSRREARDLFQSTLGQIETDMSKKPGADHKQDGK